MLNIKGVPTRNHSIDFIAGSIELREMSEIIETLYEMEGVSKVRLL